MGRHKVGTVRRRTTLVVSLVTLVALVVLPDRAGAETIAEIVNDNPANWTPNVLDGQVNAIAELGDKIVIGGTFTQVQDGVATYGRTSIASFDSSTGVIDPAFDPTLDGIVEAVIPAADGTSVYVTGNFNTVNGVTERKVARIDVATGTLVAGFDTPLILNAVKDARLVGDQLVISGPFNEVGTQSRPAIASLDADTGDLTTFVDLEFAGVHNGGTTSVIKMEVTPDLQRLLVIGNFTSVEGQWRDQVALLDISGPTATVANWYTPFFESQCAGVFSTFMRDLDIDATGTFAVISTTGAYRGGINAGVSCDTISRWELGQSGTDLEATWATYTGGDTTYAVEIGPGVVYAGGHMRWVNNPYDGDYAGPGAIPRDGIVALDTVNGMPFSWDPGRTRGVGVFDMLLTDDGLWAGSDTDRWNNELRMKLALFPAAGGTDVEEYATGSLPNHVLAVGRIAAPGSPDPGVLYRVNAGGPVLTSADDGPDWADDTSTTSPYRNSGSNRATWHSVHFIEDSVPSGDFDRVHLGVFSTERWDPAGGDEMTWSFPVTAGTPVQVRVYVANRCECTELPGERVFDIELDGAVVVDDLDLVVDHGHETAVMYGFDTTSDGSIDIRFLHEIENPLVNAIEIVQTNAGGGGSIDSDDDVTSRFFDPATGPDDETVATGTEAWRWARGGFMVDSTVYTGLADGSMQMRTFSGGGWGSPTRVALYGSTMMPEMENVTGMFFDPADQRLYYTLEDDAMLYWRWFTPESSTVGATAFHAGGDLTALDAGRVRGMFLADGWLYLADASSGDLVRLGFASGAVSGPATTVDTTEDWRARALIASTNQAPTASFTVDCTFRDCEFDATGSFDPDGTIVAYEWDFGDGTTGAGATPDHSYADPGTYDVTLTVTDDEGLTASTTAPADPTNAPPTASFTVNCTFRDCEFDATGSFDPDGTIVAYEWDFGDGTAGTGATPDHSYADPGTYDVTLTVTDDEGATGDDTAPAVATNPPPVHLHDLKPSPFDKEGDKWVARVIVKVRDATGAQIGGVDVTASFGGGKIRTCTTNAFGKCKVKIKTADTRPKMPMEIIDVQWTGGYDPSANRDVDGDGDGETVMVWRPF